MGVVPKEVAQASLLDPPTVALFCLFYLDALLHAFFPAAVAATTNSASRLHNWSTMSMSIFTRHEIKQ